MGRSSGQLGPRLLSIPGLPPSPPDAEQILKDGPWEGGLPGTLTSSVTGHQERIALIQMKEHRMESGVEGPATPDSNKCQMCQSL